MYWRHCFTCDHEFWGAEQARCDWCGSASYILEVEIPTCPIQEIAAKIIEDRQKEKERS
jgi:hypothetical protein